MSCHDHEQLDTCHICDYCGDEQCITCVFTLVTPNYSVPFTTHFENLKQLWWENSPRGEYELFVTPYCVTCGNLLYSPQ